MQILPLSLKEIILWFFSFLILSLIGLGNRIGIFLIFYFSPQTIKCASLGEKQKEKCTSSHWYIFIFTIAFAFPISNQTLKFYVFNLLCCFSLSFTRFSSFLYLNVGVSQVVSLFFSFHEFTWWSHPSSWFQLWLMCT